MAAESLWDRIINEPPTLRDLVIRIGIVLLIYYVLKSKLFLAILEAIMIPLYRSIGVKHRQIEDELYRGKTLSGFSFEYWLSIACSRLGRYDESNYMYHVGTENAFKEEVKNVFSKFLEERSYFFHFGRRQLNSVSKLNIQPIVVQHSFDQNGELCSREVPVASINEELKNLPPIVCRGHELRLFDLKLPNLSDEIVDENYTMLSEEQIERIANDPEFGLASEAFVIGLLKRRADILKSGSKKHATDCFEVETEKLGRNVRIKWKLYSSASGHHLVGFRKTDGFSSDQWSETDNGTRIVDARENGEMTDPLKEGGVYFYTFFLKTFGGDNKRGLLRFQVTMDTEAEKAAIANALKGFEKRTAPEPEKENLSKALKEVGSYMEMDTAFEAMESSFVEEINKANHSPGTKQLKIERLQDVIRQIRAKYEP
jgi:hypothetical protein